MNRRATIVALLIAGCLFASCSPAPVDDDHPTGPAEAPPSIVLISIDTLRSDRLPAYGYDRGETPHLDAFAAGATLFERAYSSCPLTLPSHATMFTGTQPPDHGVRDNREFALDGALPTVAERLKARGYATAGFVSSMVLRRSTGIARGFDFWDDAMNSDTSGVFAQRRADETVSRVLAWLETPPAQPYFLFVHLYDPHTPYAAPAGWDERFEHPYDGEIAWTDSQVGRLLEALDGNAVMILSDHGEGLGDHVESEHGLLLYREALQVPLLIREPGQTRAARREDPVGLIDVAATVLDFAGQPPVGDAGRSLRLPAPETPRGLYAETLFPKFQYGFSPMRSAIRGDLHYIESPRSELFDLRSDPQERDNLIRTRSAPPSLVSILENAGPGREARAEISAEEQDRLASLGYVGGAEIDPDAALPDPKDRVAEVEELFRLVDAVGERPDPVAELRLVTVLENLGVRNESLARTVANNLLLGERPDQAIRVLAPFEEGAAAETRILLGQAETGRGGFAKAEGHFRTALAEHPDHPGAMLGLGIMYLTGGRPDLARPWLERATAKDPALAEGWNALAVIDASAERWAPAIEAWRRALEVDPSMADAWYNLALAYEKTGRADLAAEARRRYESVTAGP